MSHSIHISSIQFDTKSLELFGQHQIVLLCNPYEREFSIMFIGCYTFIRYIIGSFLMVSFFNCIHSFIDKYCNGTAFGPHHLLTLVIVVDLKT